jgi:hypothetical protein
MRWLSLFLACQHLNSGMNLRECTDQSWFQSFKRFLCFVLIDARCFRLAPGVRVPHVEDHGVRGPKQVWLKDGTCCPSALSHWWARTGGCPCAGGTHLFRKLFKPTNQLRDGGWRSRDGTMTLQEVTHLEPFLLPALLDYCDHLCGLVVRVLGYRSEGPGSIPGTTRFSAAKKRKTSSGSGTGSTQPRAYNWGATW